MNSNTVTLSCFLITGPGSIGLDTPRCVLYEISRIHGVNCLGKNLDNRFVLTDFIDELIRSENDQPIVARHPTTIAHKSAVMRFINPYVSWPDDKLERAFTNVKTFMRDFEDKTYPTTYFSYGLPTPTRPETLTACMLYKICLSCDLVLRSTTTMRQMAVAIRMFVQGPTISRNYLRRQLSNVPESCLPSLYLTACQMVDEESSFTDSEESDSDDEMEITRGYQEEIVYSAGIFNSEYQLRLHVTPKTYGQAVALGALNFSIDLTEAQNPIKEYRHLRRQVSLDHDWVPHDDEMRRKKLINPLHYHLGTFFNPSLPYNLYSMDDLQQLAIDEGYTTQDLQDENAYSLLTTAFLSQTFYHGRYDTIINESTPIFMEELSSLPNDCVICFGTRTSSVGFYYSELAAYLKEKKSFVNPLDASGSSFSIQSIRKLKRLCQQTYIDESERGKNERGELLSAIVLTELFTAEGNAKARELYDLCLENETAKGKLLTALMCLLKLSMCCRGWLRDTDPYPIEDTPVYNQNEVDVRVTEAVINFENACDNCGEYKRNILSLPLLRYREGWQISNTDYDGKTIEARINILKTGTDTDDYSSCMRLTSNFLAASAHRYLGIIGTPPPFDIIRLRDIS